MIENGRVAELLNSVGGAVNRLMQVAASQEQQKQLREALHQSEEKLVNHAAEARHNSECSSRSSVTLSVLLCQPSFTCHAVALCFSVVRLCLTQSLIIHQQ